MTSIEFIQEAFLLRRPCIYLGESGDFFAGHLGEFVPACQSQFLFSIDERFVGGYDPSFESQFFSDQLGKVQKIRTLKSNCSDSQFPIFGRRGLSYPPIEAVFFSGSVKMQSWLVEIGWGVCAEFNDNFPCLEVTHEYEQLFQQEFPLYRKDVAVCIGGWHFPWPNDDWEQRLQSEMVAFINRGQEPWLEIWNNKGQLELVERFT